MLKPAVALLCATAVAWAAPPVRVVVIDAPGAGASGAEVAAALWAARRTLPQISDALATPDLATSLVGEGEAPADAEWGAAQLKAAKAAFADLNVVKAADKAESAALALINAGDRARGIAALSLAAEAHSAAKNTESAVKMYRALRTIAPEAKPKEGSLSPSLLRAWQDAEVMARKPAALRMEAAPSALARIDGKVIGVTPALVEQIPPGVHVVGFESDGFTREVRWVELIAGDSGEAAAQMVPLRRSALWNQIRAGLGPQIENPAVQGGLRDLRSLVFAEQAVVLQPRDGGRTVGALFDLKAGRRVRIVQVEAVGAAAGEALVRALYADLDPRSPGLEAPPEESVPGPPWHTRWWFWPAVGAVAVAAVAVPLVLLSEEPPDGLTKREDAGAVILRF